MQEHTVADPLMPPAGMSEKKPFLPAAFYLGSMNLPINQSAVNEKSRVWGIATVFLIYLAFSYFYQTQLAALSKIAGYLNAVQLYPWSISIPSLGLAFSMLLGGKLSDLFGRRALLLFMLSICIAGSVWSALSNTFIMLLIARTFLSIGLGALSPLCFSTIGDMFEPAERGKWMGLLNIPAGAFSFVGPTLGGWFTDSLSWRYIFWCGIPLLLLCLGMVIFTLPKHVSTAKPAIDARGAVLAAMASSTLILAFSIAGTLYPWGSKQVLGLFIASIISWALFIKAEAHAAEPVLDLKVLKNRTFATLSTACVLSAFGLTCIMVYYPLMMQGVQGASATLSGKVITPGTILMNFLGVAAGYILTRTRRYKWMFLLGYGLTTMVLVFVFFFTATTPLYCGVIAVTLTGIGIGAIPTLNTLVVQYAVPRKLLGVATGAIFFCVMIGQAVSPAVLGAGMNVKYSSTLKTSLPAEVSRLSDPAMMSRLADPNVLLSESAMASVRERFRNMGEGSAAFDKTIAALRLSMAAGLKIIYLIGAIAMFLAFLAVCTLPELSMNAPPDPSMQKDN